MTTVRRLYLYARFERFWHWLQAVLVLALLVTGFEVHGTFSMLGFQAAVVWHNRLAWALVVLVVFAIFWHATTGEWKQYLPTFSKLREMIRFYTVGIFSGEPHPTDKTRLRKLNPLQRLTYLGLKVLVLPVQLGTGFLYLLSDEVATVGFDVSLRTVALIHTAGAFAMVAFVIAHVYLTTTGHTVLANIKGMITGWEELPEPVEESEQLREAA